MSMQNQNTKVKIIYSLRVHIALKRLGFQPITEMKNPHNSYLNCWVYEKTQSFIEAFDRIMGDGEEHGKQ